MPLLYKSPIPNSENGLDAICPLAATATKRKIESKWKKGLQRCIMIQNPVQSDQNEIGGCKYGRFQVVFKKLGIASTQNHPQIGIFFLVINDKSVHFTQNTIHHPAAHAALCTITDQFFRSCLH